MNWLLFSILVLILLVIAIGIFIWYQKTKEGYKSALKSYEEWYVKTKPSETQIAQYLKKVGGKLSTRDYDRLSDKIYGKPSEFAEVVKGQSKKSIKNWLETAPRLLPRHYQALKKVLPEP